jgi:hypothetical protein
MGLYYGFVFSWREAAFVFLRWTPEGRRFKRHSRMQSLRFLGVQKFLARQLSEQNSLVFFTGRKKRPHLLRAQSLPDSARSMLKR